jgi:hypothetical protein
MSVVDGTIVNLGLRRARHTRAARALRDTG